MSRRIQVIGAHSADFVWRSGGAVAKAVQLGGTAEVIALSYGERGESGELWKTEGQTIENVKKLRHAEAQAAAGHLGATFRCLDLGDYPLQIDGDVLLQIADAIREFAPEVLITHTDTDPFNPDHPVAYEAVNRARGLAAGAGVPSGFKTIKPPALFLFEPHQPELCNFTPTTHVDITSVMEQKRAAMGEMKAQAYLQTYYDQRADQRGHHARRAGGDMEVRQAESFMRVIPQVVGELWSAIAELARLGSATVYEAGGRGGFVDLDLHQVIPGSRVAGPARTVRCAQDDNLMVHAVMAAVKPGEVIVLTMPEPAPVALVGDLLATQAIAQGAAGMLIDAAVRDVEELAQMGLPIWAHWVRVQGAVKATAGELDVPVVVGGATIRPGDIVVADADGVAIVGSERVDEVLAASLAREEKEAVKRAKLRGGALSYDLDGLRAVVDAQRAP